MHQLASGIQPSCFELFSGSKVSFSPIMTSEIQTPKKRCCELQLPRDLKKDQKQSKDNSRVSLIFLGNGPSIVLGFFEEKIFDKFKCWLYWFWKE